MSVTYYVALPFVRTEDGIAPGEAKECLSVCEHDTRYIEHHGPRCWYMSGYRSHSLGLH